MNRRTDARSIYRLCIPVLQRKVRASKPVRRYARSQSADRHPAMTSLLSVLSSLSAMQTDMSTSCAPDCEASLREDEGSAEVFREVW